MATLKDGNHVGFIVLICFAYLSYSVFLLSCNALETQKNQTNQQDVNTQGMCFILPLFVCSLLCYSGFSLTNLISDNSPNFSFSFCFWGLGATDINYCFSHSKILILAGSKLPRDYEGQCDTAKLAVSFWV